MVLAARLGLSIQEMLKLLLATNNPGKIREYRRLLRGLPYRLVTPTEEGINTTVEEVGTSLEENARLKATTYAALSHLITLADDSGLEVDALGGEPGPLSARYAGNNASDKKRIEHLLKRLKDIPWEERGARFRCVIAISPPQGEVSLCHGECLGIIALTPRGKGGFGYDPIFYLPQWGRTMAELPLKIKNQISHRAKAAQKARQFLEQLAETIS
jgi:XTP/dITP diphosphohydrolase